jgi:Zn-dependent metalloprotease
MRRAHFWTVTGAAVSLSLASLATAGSVQAAPWNGAAAPSAHRNPIHPAAAASRADQSFGPAQRRAAVATATSERGRTARALGLGTRQSLQVKDVVRDPDGTEHVRYERSYAGLPVVGGDFITHQDDTGAIQDVDWAAPKQVAVPTTTARMASSTARGAQHTKVIYAVHHEPVLAWAGHVTGFEADGTPIDNIVYTDATTGKRLGTTQNVMTDTGTGSSLYSGTVPLTTKKSGASWVLTDSTRGGQSTYDANGKTTDAKGTLFSDADDLWGTGTTASRQSAAVDAHYGAAETWDFYKNTFARTGIRNDGVGAYSRVHFGVKYENAFWDNSCFCMTYGDGGATLKPLVALDVAGHEMSHGVTAATDGLDYTGDAGGLNESTSDVMGTMVEFYANNASDPGDYYMGEKIMKQAGTYTRRMDNPSADGESPNCYSTSVKKLDPHLSSGVGNHLFYLLAEGTGAKTFGGLAHKGTTCTGVALTGVGRAKAAAIWYRAMTTYWVSTETYPQAANGMVKAARDLYGKNSAACKSTATAWTSVRVKPTASCNTAPQGTATTGNAVHNPGFESGKTSWTQNHTGLITNSKNAFGHAGSWYAWLGGYTVQRTDTVGQTLTVPKGASSTLRFYLVSDTNSNSAGALYDKLSVKVKSGTTTRTVGTYSNLDYSAATYDLKTIDLSAYAGKRVTVSFSSVSNKNAGWVQYLVDDVKVTSTIDK